MNPHITSVSGLPLLATRIQAVIVNALTWFGFYVCVNSLPDQMKRAFVISSLLSRLKQVTVTQDLETFVKLNALFNLTDGTASLELPTRYLGRQIWCDADIDQTQKALSSAGTNLEELSVSLADHLPKWIRYHDTNTPVAVDVERLLRMKQAHEF